MEPEQNSLIGLFSFIFGASSLAGLTRELRSKRELTVRNCVAAALSTGFYSLGMGMVLHGHMPGNENALIGLALLSGIGTQTTTEFVWSLVKTVAMQIAAEKTKP